MAHLNDNPRIGIITQARMTSTRLPGKILLEAGGYTMLELHLNRLQKTNYEIAIATTVNAQDDVIEGFARKRGIHCHRGSEHDVLGRFYGLLSREKYDVIVRVTSDCPLIDPSLINRGVELYLQLNDDHNYVSNCFPRSFARGFDFEVFSAHMLTEAFYETTDQSDREHVTPYFWKNKSGGYHLHNIDQQMNHGHLRVTIDTAEDFQLIQKLIEEFDLANAEYQKIEKILVDHPELQLINAHVEQKKN